ncbi:GntR family transcriptional regulator [Oceaniglobus ichthyenteri]|uniref:GntR family transcriptional regulator n=1 Tax=Oceaniglobus ichthyenteri TaxID=2136177 RepID=UPI0013DE2B1C|nr:GntR family transcriptional regulator [Oceaniglobus ichthyenteri]
MTARVFPWREGVAQGPQKPLTLTDRAYAMIRDQIVSRTLEPGAAFTEADLAGILGMSKTPVREALLRLQVEGFVRAIPRRGHVVAPIQISEIRDIFAFRSLIEGEAAALAARDAKPDFIDEMSDLIAADQSGDGANPDPARIANMILVNNAFHETVALAAGNRRLHRTAVQLIREFERFYYLEARLPEFYDADFVGHQAVLDAIRGGDPEVARGVMDAHIESSRRVLLKAITEGTLSAPTRAIWI